MASIAVGGAILQNLVVNPGRALATVPQALLAVHYVDSSTARALVTQQTTILGVAGFGAARPDFLPDSCPFIAAPLPPASGGEMFEIWSVSSPCRPVKFGPVTGACNEDFAFGAVALDETRSASLEAAVEAAYLSIFDFLNEAGCACPLRFWNYLTAITKDDEGLERYRRFNIGRHRAFSARLGQPLPPAASGVGGEHGKSVIYFLAGREPGRTVENPRQVSAYAYPPIYGPRSPSFSRALIHELGTEKMIFISGTASITGHESGHLDDLDGQIAETIENLRVLIVAADQAAPAPLGDHLAFKIYLHESLYRDAVDRALEAAFCSGSQRLYLRADMCRSELLIEIEAFQRLRSGGKPR